MRKPHGKALVLAAVGMLLISVSATHARQVRRIENFHSTVSFCDHQTQFAVVCADLTLAEHFSELDITADAGNYNSRLSTRCEDGQLLVTKHNNVSGIVLGDILHTCGGGLDPIRIEGAIDLL
jgi:hypothetical protein